MAKTLVDTPSAVILGPQRLAPILDQAVAILGLPASARVAVVTAGWQEREAEDDELVAALGRPAVNLRLHARAEVVFAEDHQLFDAHRAKQDRLRQLQELYRRQLRHSLTAARELQQLAASREDDDDVCAALADAIDAVRQLDARHYARAVEVEAEHEEALELAARPVVARQRQELARVLAGCEAIALAGGHVATILTRMQLLGVGDMLIKTGFEGHPMPIIAWSAGAMALSDRIILFHDRPAQGRGDAELLHRGLGLLPGVAPLPHARSRLLLDDPARVALFARRFAPAACVALDERCGVTLHGPRRDRRSLWPNTRALGEDGLCR
ncbi:MAG: Type 1 glutamine amidotransferase-like domain-containing protein [Nannocystaceae bacterium]|nr:Type 1 glutamine amidotransferase-like domain-containing protein [Myxococcales bacterium]